MTTPATRIALDIDIFSLKQQRALVQPGVLPGTLVAEILSQFRELPFLGTDPAAFELRHHDGTPLDEALPLSEQVQGGHTLVLAERPQTPPANTIPLDEPRYLLEPQSGMAVRVAWVPALIGRPDPNLPDEQLLLVRLGSLPNGIAVSRRHAQLTQIDGQLAIHSLGPNPTVLVANGSEQAIGEQPVVLGIGDTIYLSQSHIELRVIDQSPVSTES